MHVGRVCQTGLVKSSWQTFLPEAVYLDPFLLSFFHLLRNLSMERKRGGTSYLMDWIQNDRMSNLNLNLPELALIVTRSSDDFRLS